MKTRTLIPAALAGTLALAGAGTLSAQGVSMSEPDVTPAGTTVAPVTPGSPVRIAPARDMTIGDEKFARALAAEEEVTRLVKAHYGGDVFHRANQGLDPRTEAELRPGFPIPATADPRPIPAELAADLPHSAEDTTWMRIGGNMVELEPNGMVVTAVYDVLP